MIDFSYLNSYSNAENLRLYILEHTLNIEEITSKTLGYILNIDSQKSKSFGHGSTSLSFNQKVQIIQDLKGLNTTDIKKLSCLMTIRNKFAHVLSIKTFQSLFENGKSGNTIKNELDKWYLNVHPGIANQDFEFRYKICFYYLFLDVNFILSNKIGEHAMEQGKKIAQLDFLNAIKNEVQNSIDGRELVAKVATRLREEIDRYNKNNGIEL